MPAAAKVQSITSSGEDAHVLAIGSHVFTCVPTVMPFGTLLKYAKNDLDLTTMHHLLVKLVDPDQLDAVWDALDEVGIEDGQAAIAKALESYTARPTARP